MKKRITWKKVRIILLEIAAGVAIVCGIYFKAKRLIYATDIWVYSEAVLYCLVLAAMFLLIIFIYKADDF